MRNHEGGPRLPSCSRRNLHFYPREFPMAPMRGIFERSRGTLMQSIPHGGICIVVRKFSLIERNVAAEEFERLTRYLEVAGGDDYIAIFGPLSGGDSSLDMQRAFEELGLIYLDDFYALDLFLPPWLSVAFAFRPQ